MTTKLTLTIEDEVIHLAKNYANAHNQSLSSMVESDNKARKAMLSNKGSRKSRGPLFKMRYS